MGNMKIILNTNRPKTIDTNNNQINQNAKNGKIQMKNVVHKYYTKYNVDRISMKKAKNK